MNTNDGINMPEYSGWSCCLFGGDKDTGICWTPEKGKEPNWFWRFMQHMCFGNHWTKTK